MYQTTVKKKQHKLHPSFARRGFFTINKVANKYVAVHAKSFPLDRRQPAAQNFPQIEF